MWEVNQMNANKNRYFARVKLHFYFLSIYNYLIHLENSVLKDERTEAKIGSGKCFLMQAAEQFQVHNFKEALDLYEDCLSFSYRTDESNGVIFNIMSTKGALQCILGEFDRAMSTLNEVLRSDPNHYLALMRRSQVYKKVRPASLRKANSTAP
jgi:tetratricopeptide (TPR) repeat protein